MLYECMDVVLHGLAEKIKSLPHTRWSTNDPRPPRIAFEFAAENARFVKVMMNDPAGLKFFQRLQKIVVDLLIETMNADIQSLGTQPVVSLEFLSTYYAGSMLATIEWWIDNGMKYSIDEMVNMVSKAGSFSREKILGVSDH